MDKHIELLIQLYKWKWDRLYSSNPYGENYINKHIRLLFRLYKHYRNKQDLSSNNKDILWHIKYSLKR